MKITLKRMQLLNFKGCKDLVISFGQRTDISGANATGKTRIFDAFTWLFFGKDSEDRKDFNIMTLDDSGEAIHRHDSAVTAEIEIDGMRKTFQRLYIEKWQRKRGSQDPEFTGHETSYYIDGIPFLQKDYMKAVESILTEELFKLLTNPFHFSSLGWQQRREILFRMANISEDSLFQSKEEFKELLQAMNGKSFEEFKKMISERKKKIKADLQQIPPRIDELKRSMPEPKDYKMIKDEIDVMEAELNGLQKDIHSKISRYESRHKEIQTQQDKINELRSKLLKAESGQRLDHERMIQDMKGDLQLQKMSINNHESILLSNRGVLLQRKKMSEDLLKELESLRGKWAVIDSETLKFNAEDKICPACGQELPAQKITEREKSLLELFNQGKIKRLKEIEDAGISGKERLKKINAEINEVQIRIDYSERIVSLAEEKIRILEDKINHAPKDPAPDPTPEMIQFRQQIEILQQGLEEIKPVDTKKLKDQIDIIKPKLEALKIDYSKKDEEQRISQRISELLFQEKDLSQQISSLEGQEFTAQQFEKEKADLVESGINKLFCLVRFRMFNTLINGGLEPACDILIGGIPFNDANNAGKINAGLDIINALSNYYQCSAPIFVDNAEAVNALIPTEGQMIRLIVTEDPELIIK
jgi:DNA repair exonuclease SbcCD ATPase subunit